MEKQRARLKKFINTKEGEAFVKAVKRGKDISKFLKSTEDFNSPVSRKDLANLATIAVMQEARTAAVKEHYKKTDAIITGAQLRKGAMAKINTALKNLGFKNFDASIEKTPFAKELKDTLSLTTERSDASSRRKTTYTSKKKVNGKWVYKYD